MLGSEYANPEEDIYFDVINPSPDPCPSLESAGIEPL
jgi:hypothetical protein